MSSCCWMPEGKCWDAPKSAIRRGYGHLPTEMLDEWARRETMMSYQFKAGKTPGVSITEDGRLKKAEIMEQLDEIFAEKACDEMKQKYDEKYRQMFYERLEDPGLMHNFIYFDIASSEFMLQFYLSVWEGRMARVMIYLHGYGWDLSETYRKIPDDDVWNQMSQFEGMNINERMKVGELYDTVWKLNHDAMAAGLYQINVTSFGGGNEPLRLYNPPKMHWTIFDNGDVQPLQELFDEKEWSRWVDYYHDDFRAAKNHPELFSVQHLVYMFGLSMYLGEKNLPQALALGFMLMRNRGLFMFDFLHEMDSIRRVVTTQGWPVGAGEMYTMKSVDDAITAAQQAVAEANVIIGQQAAAMNMPNPGYLDIAKIHPNLVEPWGITSTMITLKKYA